MIIAQLPKDIDEYEFLQWLSPTPPVVRDAGGGEEDFQSPSECGTLVLWNFVKEITVWFLKTQLCKVIQTYWQFHMKLYLDSNFQLY